MVVATPTKSTGSRQFTPEKSSGNKLFTPEKTGGEHKCRLCHVKGHNWRTCPHNVLVESTRPGKKRMFCKKISLHSSNIQRLKLFTRPTPDSGREFGSEQLLAEAKKVVVAELDRLQALVESDTRSGFERAWFEASGEVQLWFNFAGMRHNCMNARFGVRDMDGDDFGFNDAMQVVLNKHKAMNQDEMVKTLLHEVMHHNVSRDAESKSLNEDIGHLAMALLGDQNECDNFKLGWLCCPFKRCKNEKCLKFDWS